MDIIKCEAIDNGLKENCRLYLCGNLQFPNGIDYIQTAKYEIGISNYPQYTVDKPHIHTYNMEYNYILEGEIKLLLIQEERELLLKKGDFFVIHPNEPYVGKCRAGTRTLFSKVPGGNDKMEVPLTSPIIRWGAHWDAVYVKEID